MLVNGPRRRTSAAPRAPNHLPKLYFACPRLRRASTWRGNSAGCGDRFCPSARCFCAVGATGVKDMSSVYTQRPLAAVRSSVARWGDRSGHLRGQGLGPSMWRAGRHPALPRRCGPQAGPTHHGGGVGVFVGGAARGGHGWAPTWACSPPRTPRSTWTWPPSTPGRAWTATCTCPGTPSPGSRTQEWTPRTRTQCRSSRSHTAPLRRIGDSSGNEAQFEAVGRLVAAHGARGAPRRSSANPCTRSHAPNCVSGRLPPADTDAKREARGLPCVEPRRRAAGAWAGATPAATPPSNRRACAPSPATIRPSVRPVTTAWVNTAAQSRREARRAAIQGASGKDLHFLASDGGAPCQHPRDHVRAPNCSRAPAWLLRGAGPHAASAASAARRFCPTASTCAARVSGRRSTSRHPSSRRGRSTSAAAAAGT